MPVRVPAPPSGFLCPLVIDDVVEAWLDGDNRLQVTGVRERGGRRGWLIRFADGVDKTTIQRLVGEWSSTGTAVERHHPTVSVALDTAAGAAGRPQEPELLMLRLAAVVDDFIPSSKGSTLTSDEAAEMDFELRREPSPELVPRHTTAYWVGDDPYWAQHDLDDPDFLAYVQRLAHDDVQVARALELGKHDQVMRFLEILSMNPAEWADLPDVPIFDPEDTVQDR